MLVLQHNLILGLGLSFALYRRALGVSRAGMPIPIKLHSECLEKNICMKAAVLPSQLTLNATYFLSCRP